MAAVRWCTKKDALVILVSMGLLVCNVAAVGTSGRARAKRAVCLSNLERLTHAWRLFAEDHQGRIVNGAAGALWLPSSEREVVPWVGQSWASNYATGQLPKNAQEEGIRKGALWPYVQETRLYHCPDSDAGLVLSYAIVDAMNGMPRAGTAEGGLLGSNAKGIRVGDTVLWIRNLAEIIAPGPAKRMVFIDTGRPLPGSFSIHYTSEKWWDQPPVRHGEGTSVSFTDGHCEHWCWNSERVIEAGPQRGLVPFIPEPQTSEEKEDLHRFQIAVWGRLGYEPSK